MTVVECVSADHTVLPPFVILPGKKVLEAWIINTDIPEDFSIAVSDTGYSNDGLLLHWWKHFERHSAKRQVGEYRMLLMDSFESHCTLDFIDFCEQHKIVPFCIPPHSTQLLQPLDVVLFRSCKKAHRDILNEAMQSCCANFDKLEFLHALKRIRQKAFSATSIASAFRRTGIYPLNPEVVPNQLLSKTSSTPEPPDEAPDVVEADIPPTPRSARALKRYADMLRDTDMPANYRIFLAPFLKGAVELATSESLAYQQLAVRTEAQSAHAKRQQSTKKVLPTCGVITVEDAKRKIREEKEKEEKKKMRKQRKNRHKKEERRKRRKKRNQRSKTD